MSTSNRDSMPECAAFVDLVRGVFGEPDWKQNYYFEENGKTVGTREESVKVCGYEKTKYLKPFVSGDVCERKSIIECPAPGGSREKEMLRSGISKSK